MYNKKIYCVTSLPRGYSWKRFNLQQEDLDRNNVWSKVSSRTRFTAFFEKFSFQRFKTQHTNKPKKVIKKATNVNTIAQLEYTYTKKRAKRRLNILLPKDDKKPKID